MGITMVPTLYKGIFDEDLIRHLYVPEINGDSCEGYVVRLQDAFTYGQYKDSVGKYVRPGHVNTTHNWMQQIVIPNKIKLF